MALNSKSIFLYGFQVTPLNSSLDFRAVNLGPQISATLTLGYYSLSSLADEITNKMNAADPAHVYSVSINRTINGGLENRVTISTSGSFLSLLFGSGTRAASTCATLIGFAPSDQTGATTYTGTASAGTVLVSNLIGYNFLPQEVMRKQFGSLNISSSGVKEAVVFATQKFWQVQFKYIPKTTALADWSNLMGWLTLQRLFEFTPEISSPTIFYNGTLESTSGDGKGLGFTFKEMLPQFPNLYDTGIMKFRIKE